jgi:hypothetical protein
MNFVVTIVMLVWNTHVSTHLMARLITISLYLFSNNLPIGLIGPMKSNPHFIYDSSSNIITNFTKFKIFMPLIIWQMSHPLQYFTTSLNIIAHQYFASMVFLKFMQQNDHLLPPSCNYLNITSIFSIVNIPIIGCLVHVISIPFWMVKGYAFLAKKFFCVIVNYHVCI